MRQGYMSSRGLALAIIRVVVGGWFLKAAVTLDALIARRWNNRWTQRLL
jgi:hypothetical protein